MIVSDWTVYIRKSLRFLFNHTLRNVLLGTIKC